MWTAVRVKLISKNWTKLELTIGKGKAGEAIQGITKRLSLFLFIQFSLQAVYKFYVDFTSKTTPFEHYVVFFFKVLPKYYKMKIEFIIFW